MLAIEAMSKIKFLIQLQIKKGEKLGLSVRVKKQKFRYFTIIDLT